MTTINGNRGFVLISSLIFLVVVTLLAVSAMNSATLQEKMASNMREKSRAQQIADAALREGELLLENSAFDTYQAPGSIVTLATNQTTSASTLKIWFPRGMIRGEITNDENDATAFLASAVWEGGQADPMEYTLDEDVAAAEYYVEDHDFIPRDLNPDTAAVADGGVIYRITARAKGQDPSAVAVTQSLFEKHY